MTSRGAIPPPAGVVPDFDHPQDVLKTMNLTEAAIKAMPPEQQKATEEKIAAEVARRLLLRDGNKVRTEGADAAAAI